MLKNHIKIAWRNLKSNSLFSTINIVGLSLGLAITILLYLFIIHERSYDKMHAQKDDIYRVLLHVTEENETLVTAPPITAPTIMEEVPNIKYATRVFQHGFGGNAQINANNENFIENRFFWCDNEFFKIFDVAIVQGKRENPIEQPNTVAISEATAKRYFGGANPIGQTITIDNSNKLEVTAVFKDFQNNSTLDCNLIASAKGTWFSKYTSWDNASFQTYCLLDTNAGAQNVEAQLAAVLDKNVKKEHQWFSLSLQSLSKVHLYSSEFYGASAKAGDIKEIKNISLLAILILIIACINYMNLITARSQKRSKDVGVNKTLGASTKNLITRFYIETAVITLISLVLGVLLAILAVPVFNTIVGQNLSVSSILNPTFFAGLGIIFIVTTLLAGSYPALYLSGFSPKNILSPSRSQGKNIARIRKGLVVFQFAASVVLIVSVLVIYGQLQFMKDKELGFNPESVVSISVEGAKSKKGINALSQQLKQLPSVTNIALAQGYPSSGVSGRTLRKDNNDKNGIGLKTNRVQPEIADVLQLKLLAGRMPKIRQKGDSLVDVVVNKKALAYLGYTSEEAIGKKINAQLGNNAYITGVVEDFNYETLKAPIGAYAMHNYPSEGQSNMLVRFKTEDISSVLSQFKTIFSKTLHNVAFDYKFLDSSVKTLYEKEQRTANISLVFCGLAILVACLGLFGLAAFMAEQRTKEIGVRKVLGASVFSITGLLSKDFLKLVSIALLIAFPVAFWFMNKWLQGFAYRIELNWYIFAIAGLSAIAIALITVSSQSIKAAMANPTKSLRTE